MKRIIWLVVLELLGFMVAASAQSVSPIIAEGGKGKGRGYFTARNESLDNEVVTVVARSFSTDTNGKPIFRALDPDVNLKLSSYSARLGPKQTHIFDYDITCSKNCAVAFDVMFMGKPITEGLQVALHIPTAAYVCTDKGKDCRKRMRKEWGVPDSR
jgi:hypothetical protein